MKQINCPRCSAKIGQIVKIKGVDQLQINSVILYKFTGNCINCGQPLHYSNMDRLFEKLIQRGKIEPK